MASNGDRHPARPRIEIVHGPATPAEAAAIAAAIEQFLRDTAPAPVPPGPAESAWWRDGILAATGAAAQEPPWGAPRTWGE
jgi:hypothetical protein